MVGDKLEMAMMRSGRRWSDGEESRDVRGEHEAAIWRGDGSIATEAGRGGAESWREVSIFHPRGYKSRLLTVSHLQNNHLFSQVIFLRPEAEYLSLEFFVYPIYKLGKYFQNVLIKIHYQLYSSSEDSGNDKKCIISP